MLDYGKVTDTIYKRSVRKVIERNVPELWDDRIGGSGYISHFAADSRVKRSLTASASIDRRSAGSSRCSASGGKSSGDSRQPSVVGCEYTDHCVREDLPEKSIKALVGAAAESCEKLQIAFQCRQMRAAVSGSEGTDA
ncbi:MAG: hypothetical protein ACLR1V_14290 [Coprococcus sp.]